jgi:steroid delta-isomerase
MPTSDQVRSVIETYAKTISAGDREGWLACFADDATLQDPVTAPPLTGKEAIAGFWDNVFSLADEVNTDVHHIHVCGDEAAMVFTITTKSAGGGVRIEAVDIFRVDEDGKIASQRAYWDPGAIEMIPS